MKSIITLLLVGLCSLTCQAESFKVLGFELDIESKFSSPTQINANAVSFTYPSKATYSEAQLEFVVHRYDAEAVQKMTEASAPLGKSVRVNILGLSKQPEQINKTLFMGGTAARRVYRSSVPRDHQIHVFQKMAENGSFVTVAVRVFRKNEVTGPLLRSIANTFKVSEECELCE